MSAHGQQHNDDAPTVSLAAVPAEQAAAQPLTCANCNAALVSDQRYCLSCGQPVSPVRLAFLDVLESEQSRRNGAQFLAAGGYALAPAGWAPQEPAQGAGGWLRRNTALLSLLSLLVLCLIAGLLVGHWASAGKASNGPQVIKVEGLGALSNAGSTAPSSTAGAASAKHGSASSAAKEEAEESAEAAKETKAEKAPPPPPVKVAPSKIQKLTQSTGKKHQEEINSLGAAPIETGG